MFFLLEGSQNQPLHNLDTHDTPLLAACRNGNLTIATALLNHSPGLIFLQHAQTKRSPLHLACSKGKIEMVNIILGALDRIIQYHAGRQQKTFTLDFFDELNRTPLFNACYYGFTDIVQQLIKFQKERSNDVTLNLNCAIKSSQRTPLHVAVKTGKVELVNILLSSKDIDISPEARPSKDTHKRLIQFIQKQRHGRLLPSDICIDETEEFSSNPCSPLKQISSSRMQSPITPSSSYSGQQILPPLRESPSSDSVTPPDEIKLPTMERNAFTVPKKRSSGNPPSELTTAHSTENVTRPGRSITDAAQPGESTIAVFLTHSGKFEVLPKDSTGGFTIFDKLLVTPLAEACVYCNEDIVSTLLEHGSKDVSGIACRIAYLLQNTRLMRLILSFDCSLVEPTKEQRRTFGKQAPHWLHLLWSNKLLPHCNGSLFSDDVIFRPPLAYLGESGSFDKRPSIGSNSEMPQLTRVHANRIKEINLDSNSLTEVPIEIFKLPEVHEINLSRNKITDLPQVTPITRSDRLHGWECANLVELNVSRNKLTTLPSCIWFLPNLQYFKATNNQLESLLPKTKDSVDVSSHSDTAFDEISLSHSLVSLDISNNHLRAIPDFVFSFKQLKQVNVSSNELESLPDTLWMCKSLQDLDLSKNKLCILPGCDPEPSLEELREQNIMGPSDVFGQADRVVGGVDYVSPIVPQDISSLRRQPSMLHSVTPAREPSDLCLTNRITAIEACDYSSLIKLNLAKNKLTRYPEALPCLAPNLTELDVSDNKFKDIDIQFIPQSIKKFTARRCGILRFGNVIDKTMQSVVTRNCRYGNTQGRQCLHRAHARLPFLTNLHLTRNKLQHLQLTHHKPHEDSESEVDHGEKEKKYAIGVTSLELLYPVIEGLDLSYNDLRDIFNPNVGYLQHLQWIWLNGNENLERLPLEFAYLKNTRQFTELNMSDLPRLTDPPEEYHSDTVSLSHLLSYMRSRLKE